MKDILILILFGSFSIYGLFCFVKSTFKNIIIFVRSIKDKGKE